MAASTEQLVVVLVTAGILLLVILYNNSRAAKASARAASDEPTTDPILCKFVRHEGAIVGETVALAGTHVVLKQAGEFKSVPRNQLHGEGDELELRGSIDWAEARSAGSAWHEATRRGADPEVTGELTRSEDVVSPALGAMRSRGEEE